MNLSVVVLTKNNEDIIRRCLESVKWAWEVVVIDDYSSDGTEQISKKLGARVFRRKLKENWSRQRNYGLKKALGEWVLFVDSDEVVSRELRDELIKRLGNEGTGEKGFYVGRRDVMWGKELRYGESGDIKLVRFGKKGSGVWKRRVHEYWAVEGRLGKLKNKLIHYPHQTLSEFVAQVNVYSSLHSEENRKIGKRSSVLKIIFYPVGKFVYNYFWKLGFLDGIAGFMVAVMMSIHSFLAWSKLWILEND